MDGVADVDLAAAHGDAGDGVLVFVGLGSNQGDSIALLERAVDGLGALPGTSVVACSSLYRTAAVGLEDQPDFLNQVVALRTTLTPAQLLAAGQALETAAHRVRSVRWGPRTLDVDILWYDGITRGGERLTLPHPRLEERRFVLEPLAELAPRSGAPERAHGGRGAGPGRRSDCRAAAERVRSDCRRGNGTARNRRLRPRTRRRLRNGLLDTAGRTPRAGPRERCAHRGAQLPAGRGPGCGRLRRRLAGPVAPSGGVGRPDHPVLWCRLHGRDGRDPCSRPEGHPPRAPRGLPHGRHDRCRRARCG